MKPAFIVVLRLLLLHFSRNFPALREESPVTLGYNESSTRWHRDFPSLALFRAAKRRRHGPRIAATLCGLRRSPRVSARVGRAPERVHSTDSEGEPRVRVNGAPANRPSADPLRTSCSRRSRR